MDGSLNLKPLRWNAHSYQGAKSRVVCKWFPGTKIDISQQAHTKCRIKLSVLCGSIQYKSPILFANDRKPMK